MNIAEEPFMPISVVDLYKDYLPQTNCGDCNEQTCFAFSTKVIVEKYPIEKCPHLGDEIVNKLQEALKAQYASGKWVKKDPANDALEWAKSRSSSMKIEDLPKRIGGVLVDEGNGKALELPYFTGKVIISRDNILMNDGSDLTTYEKVFIYNHIAHGGKSKPSGVWKGFEEFPNTISKMKSMVDHVERPIVNKFSGNKEKLLSEAKKIGAEDITGEIESSDLSLHFLPLPKIPIRLIFRDAIKEDSIDAHVKLLFDETAIEHLDIESIVFLSERLRQLLCGEDE
ncbi:DUF3786 domain-containing protein [Spirochaetota bacterium]